MTAKTQNLSDELFIIAIGASAGGMEAIRLLLDNTPEDGASYVIVQHLSPEHKSFMVELLAKHSKLSISLAEDGMSVISNRVYMIPEGKHMRIRNRKLYLTDIERTQKHRTIDIFFDSLAECIGDKSIAVVLSGTGSDGTKGIASIKSKGGYVIVQDPSSAKFDGMPNSAIDSGNVDVILPPESIPETIMAHIKRETLENNLSHELTEEEEKNLIAILKLIEENTPLDFSDYKRPTIIRRIAMRMAKNKINTLGAYIDFLKANPTEIITLANEFMISVTRFFRDNEAFDIIKEKVLFEIIENKLQIDIIKVWVIGCATGEEAYSIAILLIEKLTELKKDLEVKIFASDISKSALKHASNGSFPLSIEKDVSKERLDNFFIKNDNTYKIKDYIRKMIIFAEHDIVKQPPYGKLDLICCRNLLIYFNRILQRKILTSLHYCLNLGGYLFLGSSEGLGEQKKSFEEVDSRWRIYKSIETIRNLGNITFNPPNYDRQLTHFDLGPKFQKNKIKNDLNELFNQALMKVASFDAGIWVNTQFEILQTHGNYEKYLRPKLFNTNLLEILPEELSIATFNTLRKAENINKLTITKDVTYKANDEILTVNVFVMPIISDNSSLSDLMLVLYSSEKSSSPTDNDIEYFSLEKDILGYIENLKTDLTDTKHKLNDAYDALEMSNNNISSYNEELISSNEELQSTNEELQSVNEELQTVNSENQFKIKELNLLNDELNNYFKSTINAQIYVDKDLILKKFTPSAFKQINLKESDIGRDISDISTNIKFSTVIDDIRKVILSSVTVEKEIQTLNGHWYQMVVLPYVEQQGNQTNGAVITFNKITDLKVLQNKMAKIIADHQTFIYAISHDLLGPISNLSTLTSTFNESVGLNSGENQETLEVMKKSIQNLSRIVHELSDITQIENEIGNRENLNLEDLLNEIIIGLKEEIDNAKATFKFDLNVVELPFSKKNMRGILSNLMSNAIKYHSPERTPEVTIRTKRLDKGILISIEDNGLGIPENMKNKIFERLKRAHSHIEGNGIGLYLVKKIIDNVRAKIEVESEVGKGSIFKVYFQKLP